jgi:putative hydrolase of the HAD superfamily
VESTLVFDADDTLWDNNIRFNRVIDDYIAWIAHPTLDRHAILAVLHDIEAANTAVYGYGSQVFVRNLHDCFARLQERPATDAERRDIENLAAALAAQRIELVPQVAETLSELGRRHRLLLLTKGEVDEQQAKVDASGLAPQFASVHIVPEKNVNTYLGLAREESLNPAATWMIGNSPRSDIIPARKAGWRAVFIPNAHTWALEQEELDPDDGILELGAFTELLDHF